MAEKAPRARERRSPEERRRQILEAALPLFAEQGFEETGVGEIAEAAGVGTGTVYLYFPSKEHLLGAIHEEFHRGIEAAIQGVVEDLEAAFEAGEEVGLAPGVDACVDAIGRYVAEHRQECEIIIRYIPRLDSPEIRTENARAFAIIAAILEGGRQSGYVHTSDPEMTALLLGHAVQGAMGSCVLDDNPEALWRAVAQAKELIRKALVPE